MNILIALWLPILLSAVVVFIISSLIHMVIRWHAPDYRAFSNEDAVREVIRAGNPAPGQYVVPHCKDMKEFASETMVKKYADGPVGHFRIGPNGQPNMGVYLGIWFLYSLVIAALSGWLAAKVYGLDAPALGAAKLAGVISFIACGFGTIPESIWVLRPWASTAKYLLDAALYALGTAAVFYWLWP
jgi:hypothetical protein